jgi:hypothetical protein
MPNIFTQQLKASSKTTILLLFAALAMLVSGCSSTHVHNFQVDASEAPEVYGIGRYQQPKTSTMRLYGSFKIDPREDVAASGDYRTWSSWKWDTLVVQELNSFGSSGIYKMGGNEFTGGFEWFHKSDNALFGVGVSVNDGIYHHITYGFNTEHFEVGGFFGFFHQLLKIKSSFSTNGESSDDAKYEFNTNVFWGFYTGVFLGDLFVNYSLSAYRPSFDVDGTTVRSSIVTSNYITLGYNINKHLAVTAGAIGTDVNSNWHWAANLGINFYPF